MLETKRVALTYLEVLTRLISESMTDSKDRPLIIISRIIIRIGQTLSLIFRREKFQLMVFIIVLFNLKELVHIRF